ncbi:unnamed protein product [Calicophoron daubneyi]|uniref:Nuclear pore complex protein Nup88 n=1 Tax=Calicophoron daubneyi TaxID=300641 RepID=A0AAV2TJT2_CALDB
MLRREAILSVLNDLGPITSSSKNGCFSRKMESCVSPYNPDVFLTFILDASSSRLHVLKQGVFNEQDEPTRFSLILTPEPVLRISSILLSPTGRFMALVTGVSVHVCDVSSMSTNRKGSTAQPIYCAFDSADIHNPEKARIEVIKVRWHPRHTDVLVILTSNSLLFFIQCTKLPDVPLISSKLRLELNIREFHSSMDHAYSDIENSDERSGGEMESAISSLRRLDLESALGMECIDFDFGSPCLQSANKLSSIEDSTKDCCIYLLCETGDVLQVSGCMSGGGRPRIRISVLQILPPSMDNYGDNFCSILCLSALNSRRPINRLGLLELPPDVLVIADRSGHVYQGVVLHSVGQGKKRVDSVTLCLVDVIDLHLLPSLCDDGEHAERGTDDRLSTQVAGSEEGSVQSLSDLGEYSEPPLSVEPARLLSGQLSVESEECLSVADTNQGIYRYRGYYVVHHAGIHLITLPWLTNLVGFCADHLGSPFASGKDGAHKKVRSWHSLVQHLVCARLPVVKNNHSTFSGEEFQIVGLLESWQATPFCKRLSSEYSMDSNLLIVRAQPKSLKGKVLDRSALVQSIAVSPLMASNSTEQRLSRSKLTPSEVNRRGAEISALSDEMAESPTKRRSEFALRVQHLLGDDAMRMPVISALSTQTELTQMQLIDFVLKAIEALRFGPLCRLIKVRNFVEQYSARLSDHLSVQYNDASNLASLRQTLQKRAEALSDRHAVILERQQMLDKRLAVLSSRLAGLADGLTKAEVAMRDEVTHIQGRLRKGLKDWFASIRTRRIALVKRLDSLSNRSRLDTLNTTFSSVTDFAADSLSQKNWAELSVRLQKQTVEIKELISLVKLLNSQPLCSA